MRLTPRPQCLNSAGPELETVADLLAELPSVQEARAHRTPWPWLELEIESELSGDGSTVPAVVRAQLEHAGLEIQGTLAVGTDVILASARPRCARR